MKKLFSIFITIVALTIASDAMAQNWNSTFVQAYYGGGYDDFKINNNTADGNMMTVTLQHASSWKYGGNFFFINYTFAPEGFMNFFNEENTGSKSRIYSEWSPYLSLSKVTGKNVGFGPIADVSVEGSLNVGDGFRAGLGGVGLTFKTPMGTFLKLIGYYRKDNFNEATAQITGVWDIPVWKKGGVRFEGYFDLIPNEQGLGENGIHWGTDFLSQARVLFDVGRHTIFKNDTANKLEIGLDYYMHFNKLISTNAPQVAVRWSW
ncbi:hypothetical protein [Algivirga pacifica]|uniref:Outer membrane protein OmpK n=1 Tax=Algivirga pacifica TaxID=1162670 RepID=A0ABP9DEX6_9BACT